MSASNLRDFLVHLPDRADAGAVRSAHNQQHNQDATPLVEQGRVPFFGSTITQHGEAPVENGTVMIVKAESEAEIRDVIGKDVFMKEGVWDTDRVMIYPFLTKFPTTA